MIVLDINNITSRFVVSVLVVILTAMFGFWLFFVLAFLYVFFVGKPFELILAGAILDNVFIFGQSFLGAHVLLICSIIFVGAVSFLEDKVVWLKML